MDVKLDALKLQVASLFDAIKHGDEAHQQWLRKAIDDHFACVMGPTLQPEWLNITVPHDNYSAAHEHSIIPS